MFIESCTWLEFCVQGYSLGGLWEAAEVGTYAFVPQIIRTDITKLPMMLTIAPKLLIQTSFSIAKAATLLP